MIFSFCVATIAVAQPDTMIVPGQRIAEIRIGMFLDEVEKAIGQPTRRYENKKNKSQLYYYEPRRFMVELTNGLTPKVLSIRTWSPAYKTEKGVGVNTSVYDVARAYPSSIESGNTLKLDGIVFEIRNKRVHGIVVTGN